MSDEAIKTINEGISLSLSLVAVVCWELFAGDSVTNIILSFIWLIPVVFFFKDVIRCATLEKSYRSRWRYSISRPALRVLILVWSILIILIGKYHHEIGFFESYVGVWGAIIVVLVFLNAVIIKGFILVRKQPQEIVDKPLVNDGELPQEGRFLLDTLKRYSRLTEENKRGDSKLHGLSIPTFNNRRYRGDAPFVEYVNELTAIPQTYPQLASLEQFALMVADNSGVDELFDGIRENMGHLAKDGIEYAVGLKDVLEKTSSSIADYYHHPDGETTRQLLDNVLIFMEKDAHGSFFRLGLSHAQGVSGKLGYLTKHLFQDAGKGITKTFFDFDGLHKIDENFMESLREHIDDVVASFPTDVEIDIWDPDFDGSAHFPIITTAIEAFKLGGKYSDGNVDMEKAFEKSATKIGFTAGGAALGGIIGSFLLPGVGTTVGAMIGGWLGKKGAKEINMADLKKLQEDFDEQKRKLDSKVIEAEVNIESYRKETNNSIRSISAKESKHFDVIKAENPIALVSGKAMTDSLLLFLRDYLYDFLKSNESILCERERDEIRQYIPSIEQCKKYPEESLKRMLAAKEVINRYSKDSYFCDFSDIYEICISAIVEKIVMAKTSQALWYNSLLNSYKTSIYNILQMSNESVKKYIDHVSNERSKIDAEVDKLKKIKQKVEAEARTL